MEARGLFEDSFDAADTSTGGFFLSNLELAELASASDMWTTTDLHGDNLFYSVGSIPWDAKANGVDGNAIWITITERTVGMQGIKGIVFIILGEENWIICGNPSIDAIFNTLELFRSEFAIDIEVKTQALRGEVTAFLVNTGVDFFLESGEE